jgi:hypothetical protein
MALAQTVDRISGAFYSGAVIFGATAAAIVVGVPLLLVPFFVVRAYTIYADFSIRYRIDVAVEIDGRKYLGSNVYQIDYDPQDPLLDVFDVGVPVAVRTRGEALLINLGERGDLLIPLSYNIIDNIVGPAAGRMEIPLTMRGFIFANVLGHYGDFTYNTVGYADLSTLSNFPEPIAAKSEYYMPFLYIPHKKNLKGIRLLLADSTSKGSISDAFGSSAKVLYEKISITKNSVTTEKLADLLLTEKIAKLPKYAGMTISDETDNRKLYFGQNELYGDFYDR